MKYPGIKDTDLMLYVTALSTSSCSGSVLAHAGPCAYDQYGRPMAGGINVCEYFFSGDFEWKKDVQTMLHEMTHITIMISSLWDGFRDSDGNTIDVADVYDTSVSPPIIKSPLVLQATKDHFDCQTVEGLPIYSTSSSHWHPRYTLYENMRPPIWSQQMYYSKFTLALMVCHSVYCLTLCPSIYVVEMNLFGFWFEIDICIPYTLRQCACILI